MQSTQSSVIAGELNIAASAPATAKCEHLTLPILNFSRFLPPLPRPLGLRPLLASLAAFRELLRLLFLTFALALRLGYAPNVGMLVLATRTSYNLTFARTTSISPSIASIASASAATSSTLRRRTASLFSMSLIRACRLPTRRLCTALIFIKLAASAPER